MHKIIQTIITTLLLLSTACDEPVEQLRSSECDHWLDEVYVIWDNSFGGPNMIDEFGRPVDGAICSEQLTVRVEEGTTLVRGDNVFYEGVHVITSPGPLNVGIPGQKGYIAGCADSNGAQWSQQCNLDFVSGETCCASAGGYCTANCGRHVPPLDP